MVRKTTEVSAPRLTEAQRRVLARITEEDDGVYAPCGVRGFGACVNALERLGFVRAYRTGTGKVRGAWLTDAGRVALKDGAK